MATEHEMECPMPGCTEALYLEYQTSYGLGPRDAEVIRPDDAHSKGWSVGCAAGHVLLVSEDDGNGADDFGPQDREALRTMCEDIAAVFR